MRVAGAESGIEGLYLSGAGVANASFGLPDLGITTLNDVAEDARRITAATDLPLLVDIDTGFGGGFNIGRTVRVMESAGVAAVHIEDQEAQKRCGHRPQKTVVPTEDMVDRLKYALDARQKGLFIMARTDAAAVEGTEAALERVARYAQTGVDGIFAEAVTDIADYRRYAEASGLPVLANITEFGRTPLWSRQELADASVSMVIYPLSAFRVMSRLPSTCTRPWPRPATRPRCWTRCRPGKNSTKCSTITVGNSKWTTNQLARFNMADKPLTGAGLRGQIAGQTALCTVGKEGSGLTYRGYGIEQLAEKACFEEVAWLLLRGALPTRAELDGYRARLASMRQLPAALCTVLEQLPAEAHPMDVLRTGCSTLGNLESETDFDQAFDIADRLLATMPAMVVYWYRYATEGVRIETRTDAEDISGHFLHLLHGRPAPDNHRRCLDCSLILYAEHEYNASTFTARICASTLSDMHSCITGAIGSLRGPLHGGANEAAMEMMARWDSPEQARRELADMLERKEKIMGFGHAIYRESDPRNAIIKKWAQSLAREVGDATLIGWPRRSKT